MSWFYRHILIYWSLDKETAEYGDDDDEEIVPGLDYDYGDEENIEAGHYIDDEYDEEDEEV